MTRRAGPRAGRRAAAAARPEEPKELADALGIRSYRENDQQSLEALWATVFTDDPPHAAPAATNTGSCASSRSSSPRARRGVDSANGPAPPLVDRPARRGLWVRGVASALRRARPFLGVALSSLLITGCSQDTGPRPDHLEPNDGPSTATAVELDYASGRLTIHTDDVDWFVFTLAEAATIIAEVEAWVLGSALDPVMALFDAEATLMLIEDDTNGFDPSIVASLAAGTYFVGVKGFFDSRGSYHLSISIAPDQADVLEPNDALATATAIELDYASGRLTINTADDVDWFVFTLAEAGTIIAEVEAWVLGSALDPVMALFDAEATLLIIDYATNGLDPRIEARLAAGTYYVEVSSFRGGSRGFYDLSINLAP
jgi:uncharacterized protein YaiE (UPF0345 family)